MCRALQILCAAPDRDALGVLKRAVVSAEYELTGGATDAETLLRQIDELQPDAVVVEGPLADAAEAVRARFPSVRIVVVGGSSGAADESVADAAEAKAAILGMPRPGGPVR